LALRIAIAEKIEHQATDRIGRIARVSKQIIDSIKAGEVYVRSKRAQQIGEGLTRNIKTTGRIRERNENRMMRSAGISGVQLALPFFELC